MIELLPNRLVSFSLQLSPTFWPFYIRMLAALLFPISWEFSKVLILFEPNIEG